MKVQILFMLVFLSGWSISQSNFYKQYSNGGYDFGQGIIELPDSSYVITGASSSFTEGPSQMFLLKIDSLGNYVWSNHYGGAETDWGRRVKYIENDAFFVGGYTNSSGNGSYDYALWKIDENGNEEWFRTYGTAGWERVHDMAMTADNGVILVGETNNTDDGFTDIYIVRTDYDGNVLWENQIENPGDDNAFTIAQFDDSTFIIGGYFYNGTSDFKQAWMIRIQDDGSVLWNQAWGDDYHYDIADIAIYNGEIYAVGGKYSGSTDDMYLYTAILNGEDGDILLSHNQSNSPEIAVGITQHNAPFFFGVCTSNMGEHSYGEEDLYFFGFSNSLDYYVTLGAIQYATSQVLGEIITTYNYGSIAVGYNEGIGPGGSSIYVLRMGKDQPYISSNDDFSTNPFVSVTAIEQHKGIAVFPNPANEKLTISYSEGNTSMHEVSLTNTMGQEIMNVNTGINPATIDVGSIAKGIYILIIRSEQGEIILNQKVEIN